MKSTLFLFLCSCLLLLAGPAHSQTLCNTNGNLVMFANYDGGVLNINCDVNIPNLKIGICTYEPVTINITGTFASNVTEVRYAGYVSTNNFHCNNSPSTTTITGVPSNITSINYLPQATLSNPNGYGSIVCAYSCPTTSSQGGCNTSDQVVDYFQTSMNAAMRSYYTQYGCWSTTPYTVSTGGNCCPNVPPPGCNITANAGADTTICSGNPTQLNGSTTGGSTYSWSPATGLSCTNCANPIATPSVTTTYILTVTDGSSCTELDSVTIAVNSPQVSTTPFNAVCENDSSLTLSGGTPPGGTWSGPGVSGGLFDPNSSGPGNHTVTYSYIDMMGCTGSSSQSIVVHNTSQLSHLPLQPVCENDPPFFLSGGTPSGGTYTGVAVLGGAFNPSVAGPGIFNMVYHYSNANNCESTIVVPITVSAIPATPAIAQAGSDSLYASIPADSFSWFLNGTQIPGNTQVIQTTQNGNYTVIAWINGCPSAVSTSYPYEFVAIDAGQMTGWQIYPNPITLGSTSAFITLKGPNTAFEYSIYDLAGKRLSSGHGHNPETKIDLNQLPAGSYLLEVKVEGGRQVIRLVVQ
jgi:hypothetical protein